jgi:hypothetical protein
MLTYADVCGRMQSVLSAALPAPEAAVEEAVEVEELLLSRQARWNSKGRSKDCLASCCWRRSGQGRSGGISYDV